MSITSLFYHGDYFTCFILFTTSDIQYPGARADTNGNFSKGQLVEYPLSGLFITVTH